jgi:hypothetical protein
MHLRQCTFPLFLGRTNTCSHIRLVFTFIMPIGLGNIGWKMYMINASWDVIILGLIVRWILKC